MLYLIAGLAFFVAMAALYLASEVTRKTERRVQEFVTNHIVPLKESQKKSDEGIKALQGLIRTQEREMKAIRATQDGAMERLTHLGDEIGEVRAQLVKLGRLVPSQIKTGGGSPGAP